MQQRTLPRLNFYEIAMKYAQSKGMTRKWELWKVMRLWSSFFECIENVLTFFDRQSAFFNLVVLNSKNRRSKIFVHDIVLWQRTILCLKNIRRWCKRFHWEKSNCVKTAANWLTWKKRCLTKIFFRSRLVGAPLAKASFQIKGATACSGRGLLCLLEITFYQKPLISTGK